MINSIIAADHFYYFVLLDIPQITTIEELLGKIDQDHQFKIFLSPNNEVVYHLQVCLKELMGSEHLLQQNSIYRNGSLMYWYDFYLRTVMFNDKPNVLIGYPYIKLGRFLDELLATNKIKYRRHIADMNIVMNYFRNRGASFKQTITEDKGVKVDITKYAAIIMNDIGTDSFDLKGNNPLKSKLFNDISGSSAYYIRTKFLRLNYQDSANRIDVSFDALGSFKIWIRNNNQVMIMLILPNIFLFLNELNSISSSTRISSNSILLDDSII